MKPYKQPNRLFPMLKVTKDEVAAAVAAMFGADPSDFWKSTTIVRLVASIAMSLGAAIGLVADIGTWEIGVLILLAVLGNLGAIRGRVEAACVIRPKEGAVPEGYQEGVKVLGQRED